MNALLALPVVVPLLAAALTVIAVRLPSLQRALTFVGAVNIQCRVVDGVPVVFEINPRFSGGIPLTIAAGADFPRMVAELTLGRRVDAAIGVFRHDLWMTSYESSLFLGPAHMNRLLPAELARAVDVEAVA